MAVSEEYLEFVLDQLETVGGVHARRMFGGVGIYCDDLFFAVIDNDTLYFKVDDITRPRYEGSDCSPFRPYGEDSYSMSYYTVPDEILEDRDELVLWARESLDVAIRKLSTKRKKSAGPKKRKKQ